MSDTNFRTWMDRLKNISGARPEWPLLLSWMLEEEFLRQQQNPRPYSGQRVLIDRLLHKYDVAVPEKRAVYGLCHRCWQEAKGCLWIEGMPIWLLSYEVPNQASENGRRADLVGITMTGGLVVFEGKLGTNSYPPISAILEGLDYLSCLTSKATFDRLITEFHEMKVTGQLPVPEGFDNAEPNRSAQPLVIVLADSVYFDFYDRSERSPGWREMVRFGQSTTTLSMRFARAELDADRFFSREVSWLQ